MYVQRSNIRSTKKSPLNKNMDTEISTPSLMHSVSKNKESYYVISSNNTIIDMLTASLPSFFSSYKETPGLHNHCTHVYCQSITGKIDTDQIGRFFVLSVSSNNYLLILFDLDINSIFIEPITNCTKHSIKIVYAKTLKILKNRLLQPQLHILENED